MKIGLSRLLWGSWIFGIIDPSVISVSFIDLSTEYFFSWQGVKVVDKEQESGSEAKFVWAIIFVNVEAGKTRHMAYSYSYFWCCAPVK